MNSTKAFSITLLVCFSVIGAYLTVIKLWPPEPTAAVSVTKPAPKDDCDLLLSKYGPPDSDESTDRDVPRPPIPTRFLTYKKEHVRWIYVPDWAHKSLTRPRLEAEMDAPPPYRWKLIGATDPRTNAPLTADVAVARLGLREIHSIVSDFRERHAERIKAGK